MMARLIIKALGIIWGGLGVYGTIAAWRSAFTSQVLPVSDSTMAAFGPFLLLVGGSMLVFREEQLRSPGDSLLGRKLTPLGLAIFLLALAAGIGNYILVGRVAQGNR
jgi:hypothetical protein